MELIKVEDLDVGDEILISCQSCFKYLRVLRKPAASLKKHWRTGDTVYKGVKCSVRRDEIKQAYVYNNQTRYYTSIDWRFGPDDHNFEQYVNLNHRQILLVRKK
jgi:hypothetical protein